MTQPTRNDAIPGELDRLQAAFKQHGHSLYQCWQDGQPYYVASNWGMARQFATLQDVQAFLKQIGGDHK